MASLPSVSSEDSDNKVETVKLNSDCSTSNDQCSVCTPAAPDSGFRPSCHPLDTSYLVSNDQPLDFSMKKTNQKVEPLTPSTVVPEYVGCFSKFSPIPSTPSPKPCDSATSSRFPIGNTSGYGIPAEIATTPLPYLGSPSSMLSHPIIPTLPTVLSYAKVSGVVKQKNLRPFKAYRCDTGPMGFNYSGIPHLDLVYSPDSSTTHNLFAQHDAYMQFRRRMLAQKKSPTDQSEKPSEESSDQSVQASGESSQVSSAGEASAPAVSKCQTAVVSTTYRKRSRTLPDEMKDETYWERRKKNNEAAKRSRDARRAKEDELAIKTAFLEQDNIRLTVEVNTLRSEIRGSQDDLNQLPLHIFSNSSCFKHLQRHLLDNCPISSKKGRICHIE